MTMSTERIEYLDALRAFALILGVVFHAGLSFMPVFIGWAVMDINTSPVVSIFSLVSHSFRMPLFFLIAGFFTCMSLQKYGVKALATSRAVRLGIPFIAGWFLLRPLLVSGWVMGGQSMRGEADIPDGLWQGLNSLTELPAGMFTGTHLWFLYYLMLFTAIAVLVSSLLERVPATSQSLALAGKRFLAWLCTSRLGLVLRCLLVAGCLWRMEHWGLDTPDKSLWPHIPLLLIYGGFFLLGWGLYQHQPLLADFMQISWFLLTWLVISVMGAIFLSAYEMHPGHEFYLYYKAGFVLCYASIMWLLTAALMTVCKRLFSQPNATISYLSARAYWLYLIHLPLVVWLQVAFAEMPLHWLVKLISITLITLAIAFTLFELIVKRTWLQYVLSGASKPVAKRAG